MKCDLSIILLAYVLKACKTPCWNPTSAAACTSLASASSSSPENRWHFSGQKLPFKYKYLYYGTWQYNFKGSISTKICIRPPRWSNALHLSEMPLHLMHRPAPPPKYVCEIRSELPKSNVSFMALSSNFAFCIKTV